jgi:hypothetical protein
MTTLKILQYNTDNLRHGWEYFTEHLAKADIAVLQRFPKQYKPKLVELMSGCRSYMVESCPPLDMGLVIARNRHAPSFSGIESITLPSAQHVMAVGDPWQGCTALKTVLSGVNIVSFLPCYQTEGDEYPISFGQTRQDIKFLLEKFKDEPTIIMGDFHCPPNTETVDDIIERNGFTSHLDSHKTFRKANSDEFFNLDKCISNIEIYLTEVKVHDVPNSVGHMAINYTLNIDK